MRFEFLWGTDTREQEYLRGVDSTSSSISFGMLYIAHGNATHERRTSFLAPTNRTSPARDAANSTPTARLLTIRIFVTCAPVTTLRFGRARTEGVRYADLNMMSLGDGTERDRTYSVETRLPIESMYIGTRVAPIVPAQHKSIILVISVKNLTRRSVDVDNMSYPNILARSQERFANLSEESKVSSLGDDTLNQGLPSSTILPLQDHPILDSSHQPEYLGAARKSQTSSSTLGRIAR